MGEENRTPTLKWWQWVLMYPTLAITLAGSIPTLYTLYQSIKFGVPFGEVGIATRREEVFNKSADCLSNLQFHAVPGGEDASISVGVCPQGKTLTVLIQPHSPKAQPIWRPIYWGSFLGEPTTSLLIKEAAAEEALAASQVAQAGPTTLCQKRLGSGRLLIRLKYPSGECVDQTVNTFTGVVISTVSAPCDSRC
jgi:hypothetical protein